MRSNTVRIATLAGSVGAWTARAPAWSNSQPVSSVMASRPYPLPRWLSRNPIPTSNVPAGSARSPGTNVWIRPIAAPSRSMARSIQPSTSWPERRSRARNRASSGTSGVLIGSAVTIARHCSSISSGRSGRRTSRGPVTGMPSAVPAWFRGSTPPRQPGRSPGAAFPGDGQAAEHHHAHGGDHQEPEGISGQAGYLPDGVQQQEPDADPPGPLAADEDPPRRAELRNCDEQREKSPGTQVAEQILRGGAESIRAGDQGEAGHEVVARGEGHEPGREGDQALDAARKNVTICDHGGSGRSFGLLKAFRLWSWRAFHASRQPSARRVTGG